MTTTTTSDAGNTPTNFSDDRTSPVLRHGQGAQFTTTEEVRAADDLSLDTLRDNLLRAHAFLETTRRRRSMDDKDVSARPLQLPSRSRRHRSVAIAAVSTVAALFLGSCDRGESPQ